MRKKEAAAELEADLAMARPSQDLAPDDLQMAASSSVAVGGEETG